MILKKRKTIYVNFQSHNEKHKITQTKSKPNHVKKMQASDSFLPIF